MKKRYVRIRPLIIIVFILAGFLVQSCQDVFTYNIFNGAAKDLSDMSDEEQVAYIENLITSGDSESLGAAYASIAELAAEGGDSSLNVLASQVAMGASGATEAISDLAELASSEEGITDEDVLEIIEEGIDSEMLQNAVDQMDVATQDEDAEITDEQYINAASAIVLLEIQNSGGTENVDWDNDEDILQAEEWLESGGMTLEEAFALFGVDTE